VDRVCHAGAVSSPWGSRTEFQETNVTGTSNIIAGCVAHGVRRLVYISSPSVVFNGKDQEGLTEQAPYPPRFTSTYSETKKLGEDLVNAAREGGRGLETVILRPKAIFGPGDTALLPRLMAAARRGRLPQIGDGLNRVDLTYVDNVVDGALAALDSTAAVGKTYTLTNGESRLLWEVIRDVLRRSGLDTNLRQIPVSLAYSAASLMEGVSTITRREPLLTRYSVLILARTQTYNITAARRDLSYAPRVSIAEGIERTLATGLPST
jgi:nucleoside-diphosphate-sugar epimerase